MGGGDAEGLTWGQQIALDCVDSCILRWTIMHCCSMRLSGISSLRTSDQNDEALDESALDSLQSES